MLGFPERIHTENIEEFIAILKKENCSLVRIETLKNPFGCLAYHENDENGEIFSYRIILSAKTKNGDRVVFETEFLRKTELVCDGSCIDHFVETLEAEKGFIREIKKEIKSIEIWIIFPKHNGFKRDEYRKIRDTILT